MNAPLDTPSAQATSKVTHFAESAFWTGASIHDKGSWLLARRRMVTASRMAALLGMDPKADAMDVYADMAASREPPEFEAAFDSPMYWGTVLEQPIARAAADHYGWELHPGGYLLASRRCPSIGATLDAEIRSSDSARWIVYEGKTVSVFRFRDWDEDAGLPPDRILIQAQTQLLVTGAESCVVFALVGGNRPCRIDVAPIPELHDAMVESVEELLERVADLDPPPPTWKSGEAIARLYPNEKPGKRVQLGHEAVEWTRELEHVAGQMKQLERRKEELRNHLRLSLGTAAVGELPEAVDGKREWKWATQMRPAYSVEASSSRVLRLVKGDSKPKGENDEDEEPRARRRRQARRA